MLKSLNQIFTETLSDIPVAKPTRLRIPSQSEKIMALVRFEQARALADREVETFEDADDFELDDNEEWFSPYEEVFESAPEPVSVSDQAPAPAPPGAVPAQAPPAENVPRSPE